MPPSRWPRLGYAALVGIIFAPAMHIGSFYSSPEIALLAGNLFSFIVSPKGRVTLTFVEKRELARGIYEFIFKSDRSFAFRAGQYLEWALSGVPADSRGNRRFFTIASAPEDAEVRLGMRLYDAPSAFKRTLMVLEPGAKLYASGIAGDFILPKDEKRKLAFIAGGIGVTPFASMARHIIAVSESRDAILLYSSRTEAEIAYKDVFAKAGKRGLRTVYAVTDEQGPINAAFIEREIPDYRERLFYISGPPGLVDAMREVLSSMGVSRSAVKTDYFPGLA